MIYLFCGLIIGMVMGLTGAGGALIAIPLFIHFLGMSLREASVYSLIAVVIASLMNFVEQRKATQYQVGVVIVLASAVGSIMTAPFKELLPVLYVAIILSLVSVYALYNVWVPLKITSQASTTYLNTTVLSVITGLFLGALTTFTGLGGGVLLLPIFLAFFHYSQTQSVATSLFAVGLSSLVSLGVQIFRGTHFDAKSDLILLMLGILVSVFLLKQLVRVLPQTVMNRTRQTVFTIVVVLSLLKIF